MSHDVRQVADSVLFEGYVLYPYRASAQKNRSRWQFGVLMPQEVAAADPSERSMAQAECVFEHSGEGAGPVIEVAVRFLQVQRRTSTSATLPTWDEAVEREVRLTVDGPLLSGEGCVRGFVIPGGQERETVGGASVVRRREQLLGSVRVRTTPLPGPWRAARLTVAVANELGGGPGARPREAALPSALVAVHMIITISGGAFISMTDPPEWASEETGRCENIGCWPVLAGPPDSRQVMLASPIILPDHPELAAESPGDLYDGTEIDEILTLRTMALTDEEKTAARATDPRAAALIDRVDAMDAPAMARLHGTIRGLRPPGAVFVAGRRVVRGSRVTLRPGVRRADAQDMFLDGRTALVEEVLFDVDDTAYLAVSLTDDPGADLRSAHGRFLYFAPDEVEPCQ